MSDRLHGFLLALSKDQARQRRFVTDAKAFAEELHKADLTHDDLRAILSRDSGQVRKALSPKGDIVILMILDWFKDLPEKG
jgi:hypothetical protein